LASHLLSAFKNLYIFHKDQLHHMQYGLLIWFSFHALIQMKPTQKQPSRTNGFKIEPTTSLSWVNSQLNKEFPAIKVLFPFRFWSRFKLWIRSSAIFWTSETGPHVWSERGSSSRPCWLRYKDNFKDLLLLKFVCF